MTRADLDAQADALSLRFRNGLSVRVQGRNGYLGLDLWDAVGVVDTLRLGTKKEIATYLAGMARALDVVNR